MVTPPRKPIQDKTRVQSVRRALQLLQLFNQEMPEWGVSDLSRKLMLPKAIVFRLLATMEDEGFIEQNPENQKYRLGKIVFKMAAVYTRHNTLINIGDRGLKNLAAETCQSALIGVLDGTSYMCLAVIPTQKLVGLNIHPGDHRPAHATAAGKVLLAGLDNKAVCALFPSGKLEAITRNTITDLDMLLSELDQVRKQGYAIAHDESYDGLSAVAAPIRDYRGRQIAALALGWLTPSVSDSEVSNFTQRVIQVAEEMSHQLGNQ